MIHSMTGFGTAEGVLGQAKVVVEARSVNHRFLNLTARVPPELSRWEGEIREAVRKHVSRGHVTVTVRVERPDAGTVAVDEERVGGYVRLLRKLRERFALAGDVDLATILKLPDVFTNPGVGDDVLPRVVELVESALQSMNRSRQAEGAALAAQIARHLDNVEAALQRVEERSPVRIVEQRDRLREAVRQLTSGVSVDEQRLAMEIAILAERLDIAEEITRLRTHSEAVRQCLQTQSADAIGKRLGFLLQEMLREANTIGAKASDALIAREVISIKEELERMREQVENLE